MAALSSGLLARKGQARPAMRSGALMGVQASQPDELGWNDMGAALPTGSTGGVPPVLVQRDLLEARVGSPAAVAELSLTDAQRIRRAVHGDDTVAIALPVDADRHLRLRLAAAITDRPVQDLMTEALDALLAAVPQVDTLVAQLARERIRP